MSADMDDIYSRLRENLELVQKREHQVTVREQELQTEANGLKQKEVALDNARLEFERKTATLEKEKAKMSGTVTNEDVVEINVQGEKFCASRGTLTQFPETRLTYMFNGRWKDKMQKDSTGTLFLDVPPAHFRALLDYLTHRRMAGSDAVPLPRVHEDQMSMFKSMLNYFEVESAIYSRTTGSVKVPVVAGGVFVGLSCFSEHLKSPFIELISDGSVATNASQGMGYVLGEDVYEDVLVHFVLEIKKLEEPWMFFGVMSDDASGRNGTNEYTLMGNPNAFGWADRGGFWKGGVRQEVSECTIPADSLHQGQIVEMILNCCTNPNTLLIKLLPEKHIQEVSNLPFGRAWRLYINLICGNDSVRLIKAERTAIENAS